jgi:hypothetical protein
MLKNAHFRSMGTALMRALGHIIPSLVANISGYGRARHRGVEGMSEAKSATKPEVGIARVQQGRQTPLGNGAGVP